MDKLRNRAAALLSVKALVTLALTITFCVLTCMGHVTQEFNTVYLMVIAFYFGQQSAQTAKGGGENGN